MFNLFLRLLPQLKIPARGSKEDLALRQQLGFDDNTSNAEFISKWLGKLMLLSLRNRTRTDTICFGLTNDEYEYLTLGGKEETWTPASDKGLNLTETKLVALKLLSSGAFTDSERYIPALCASGDNNSHISEIGESLLKRSTVSLEDSSLIANLFEIYFVVRPALRRKILILLSKSAISTTFTSEIISLVKDAVNSEENAEILSSGLVTIKFRNALFNFVNWTSRMATRENSDRIAPHLFELLKGYIMNQGWPLPLETTREIMSLRALAYETLGLLLKSSPNLVLEPSLIILRWLFSSLTEEKSSDDVIVSIEGALSSLQGVFVAPLDRALLNELRQLLLRNMTLEENDTVVRNACFTTVRWANRCLEYSDVVGRWIDILAVGSCASEHNDIMEEGNKGLVS